MYRLSLLPLKQLKRVSNRTRTVQQESDNRVLTRSSVLHAPKNLTPVHFDDKCSQHDKATGSAIDVGSSVETLSIHARITCRSRTVLQILSFISSDVLRHPLRGTLSSSRLQERSVNLVLFLYLILLGCVPIWIQTLLGRIFS